MELQTLLICFEHSIQTHYTVSVGVSFNMETSDSWRNLQCDGHLHVYRHLSKSYSIRSYYNARKNVYFKRHHCNKQAHTIHQFLQFLNNKSTRPKYVTHFKELYLTNKDPLMLESPVGTTCTACFNHLLLCIL